MVPSVRRFLRKRLPTSGYARLRKWRAAIDERLAALFSATERLASVYYVFDRSFGREHRAVLAGKKTYFVSLRTPADSSFLLRRNVHRLEKGLISRPRRPVFAASYIDDTVEAFTTMLRASDAKVPERGELRWAYDVLSRYFEVCEHDPSIQRARERFVRATSEATVAPRAQPLTPRGRETQPAPPVAADDFVALCIRRRSVRWFAQRPVPRQAVDEAIEAAALSPSACNRLPYRFLVFDEPSLVHRVASLPAGTRGFEHNFPAVVVIVGRLRAYYSERDRHLIYVDGSLAAMSFMLALETHGLSSCPINWADERRPERRMRALLGLALDERPIMLVAVGYPDPTGGVPASEKRPLEQLRAFNAVAPHVRAEENERA